MNRQMAFAVEVPLIFLVNPDSNQVRHNFCEPLVVVSFDPDNFNVALGIREFSYVRQKTPVFFREASKIQIAKNVPEEDETSKRVLFQDLQRCIRAAYVRPEVQVRQYQRVETRRSHSSLIRNYCYNKI